MDEATWRVSMDPGAMLTHLLRQSEPHLSAHRGRAPGVTDRKLRLLVYAIAPDSAYPDDPLRWLGWLDGWIRGTRGQPEERERFARACAAMRCIFGNPFSPAPLRWEDGKLSELSCYAHHGMHLASTPYYEPVTWLTANIVDLARTAYEERVQESVWEWEEYRGGAGGQEIRRREVITGTTSTGTLDPDRLAVLGDALEEAGCEGEECEACRGYGQRHYCRLCRGLWVGVAEPFCPECGWKENREVPCEVRPCELCGGTGRVPHPLLRHLKESGSHYRGCWSLDLLLSKE
jgi:hypothetical protein